MVAPSKYAVTVVDKPQELTAELLREKCTLAVRPRSVCNDHVGDFTVGSLVVDCSDRYALWEALQCATVGGDIDSIISVSKKHSTRTGSRCLHSVYSIILGSFTHKHFASFVSPANLVALFNTKFTTTDFICVDSAYTNCRMENFLDIFVSLQTIANNLDEGFTPSVREYTTIVKEISKHPLWVQVLLEETVNLRCGPLRDITARVNVQNIGWFMNQIKLTNSVDLLHKLFTSPSVMGKCSAIYSLLELHELLWRTTDFAMIESIVPTLYTILAWIFDKCRVATQKVGDSFNWVKAKFRREENEQNLYNNVGQDLPETPSVATPECAEPGFHRVLENFDFEKWLKVNVFGVAEAQISEKNNCLFEALSQYTQGNPLEMRTNFFNFLHDEKEKCVEILIRAGFEKEDAERILEEMKDSINKGELLGNDLLPLLQDFFQIRIAMASFMNDSWIVFVDNTHEDKTSPYFFIRNDDIHWRAVPRPEGGAMHVSNLLGIEDQLVEVIPPPEEPPQIPEIIKEMGAEEIIPEQKKPEMIVEAETKPEDAKKIVAELESTEMGRGFLAWFKTMVSDVYNFFRTNPIIGGVIAFAFSVMSGIGITIGKFSNSFDKRSFWERVSSCSKDFYYLSRGQDAVSKVFGDFGQIFRAMMGIDDNPQVTEFKNSLVEICEKAEQMNELCINNPEVISNDPQKLCEFKKSMEKISKQYRDLVRFDSTVNLQVLQPLWMRLNQVYQHLLTHYGKLCNNTNSRQRPYCLWLYGRSNIGKSELVDHIIREFNRANGTAWEKFTVSKGPEYLNGFKQERIILIDDFDSFVMQEGCLDALLIMNMVTCASYNPNMAHLDDKNVQAKPALIIVVSNYATARLNSGVNSFEAFERRRDKLVKVTWPEHEDCNVNAKCEHRTNLEKDLEKTGVKKFDHLHFFDEDTMVISHSSYEGDKAVKSRKTQCKPPPDNGFDTKEIQFQDIIDDMVERVRYYKLSHEATLRANEEFQKEHMAMLKQAIPQGPVTEDIGDWNVRPNIMLTGPPGTGKSFCMEQMLISKPKTKFKHIRTIDEFNSGAPAKWFYGPDYEFVVFDDYTTFKDSPHVKTFWTTWKSRYDSVDPKIATWVLGVNEMVAIETFNSPEDYLVHARRSHEFRFRFLSYRSRETWYMSKAYTCEDLKKVNDENPHSNYVEIRDEVADQKIIQSTLSNYLSSWKPLTTSHTIQTVLPTVQHLDVDCIAFVAATTDEFINIINSKGTSVQALSMLTSHFQSEKFSKIEVAKRIYRSFANLSNLHGSHFPNMDEFVLCGANNGFFKEFKDGNFVMKFKDKSYCLYPLGERVCSAIYAPVDSKKDLAGLQASMVSAVTTVDFLKVTHSQLPPWFILSVSIAEQVLKIIAAGAVIAHNVHTRNLSNKMLRMHQEIEKNQNTYVESGLGNISTTHKKVLLGDTEDSGPLVTGFVESPTDGNRSRPVSPKHRGLLGRSARKSRAKFESGKALVEYEKSGLREELRKVVEDASVEHAEPEIATDNGLHSVIHSCLKNMVSIVNLNNEHLVHGLILYDRFGTTVNHAFHNDLYTERKVKVKTIDGQFYMMKILHRDPTEDRVDFELIDCKNSFADIRRHLSQHTNSQYNSKLGCLVNMDLSTAVPILVMRFYRIQSYGNVSLKNLYTIQAWSYQGGISGFKTELPPQTVKGDCGSVMFLCDPKHNNKMIGMHVASASTEGYFRQLRDVDYQKIGTAECATLGSGTLGEFMPPYYPQDEEGHPVLAKCTKNPFLPNKTNLYRSPFAFGVCEYEPSVLDKNDFRRQDVDDMIISEARKWIRPVDHGLTQKDCEIIRSRMAELGDWVGQKINAYGIRTFKLNKTTALNSARGFTHSQPIPLGTSAGYPFNQIESNGKRGLIDVLEDGSRRFAKTLHAKWLHNAIDKVLEDARQGKSSDLAFLVFGKDELLKKGKNTRTIAAAPLSLVVPLRMYFHTIYAAMSEVWNVIPIKVGIASNKLDWHTLAISFLNVSDTGFAIDQRNFDFNIPKPIVEAVIEFLLAVARATNPDLTEEDIRVMRALHFNVAYFNIIIKGLIYRSTVGVGSGHPGTSPENSGISLFLFYDAFCALAPSWFIVSVEVFMECVALAVYGDDATCTVTPSCLEWFNQVTVTQYLTSKYGLVITNADKTDQIRPYYHLTEMTFLSRNFVKEFGYWVGPLEMKRLLKPLNFCHGQRSHHWYEEPDELTDDMVVACAAARSALDEMFFHGRKKYEELRNHCIKVAGRLGILEAYFPPWSTRYAEFFEFKNEHSDGLQILRVAVRRDIVQLIQQCRPWFSYANRRCILFGEDYSWDEKSSKFRSQPMPLELSHIVRTVNGYLKTSFNQILVNEYPVGGEIPYHRDNEKGLDLEEGVASLTIIGNGTVKWQNNRGHIVRTIDCVPELLYYMKNEFVTDYRHCRSNHTKYTMSLTFRKIIK